VAARFGDRVRFDFDTRQQFDSFVQHPLGYEHQFEIPPGNYRFKLIFRTGKDRFGGIETPLAVDPVDAAQISMSAIALSHDVQPISQDAADEAVEEGRKPLIFRGNQVMIAGSDVLPRTGNAEAYFEIYEPLAAGNEPVQLTMQLRLLDAQSNQQKWDWPLQLQQRQTKSNKDCCAAAGTSYIFGFGARSRRAIFANYRTLFLAAMRGCAPRKLPTASLKPAVGHIRP
jgi:hypothetical protein